MSSSPATKQQRYFCHACNESQTLTIPINPVTNAPETDVACQFCQSGFIEEVETPSSSSSSSSRPRDNERRGERARNSSAYTYSNSHYNDADDDGYIGDHMDEDVNDHEEEADDDDDSNYIDEDEIEEIGVGQLPPASTATSNSRTHSSHRNNGRTAPRSTRMGSTRNNPIHVESFIVNHNNGNGDDSDDDVDNEG